MYLMRTILFTAVAVAATYACGPRTPGPAVRLSSGASDTIIVNNSLPTPLPLHALDGAGRPLALAAIRYMRTSGADVPISSSGIVTCTKAGDLAVQAVLERLSEAVVVRCRPVAHVRLPGPVQFVLGDSAWTQPSELSIAAYDSAWRRVLLYNGRVKVLKPNVAIAHGGTVSPVSRGKTVVGVWVGDESAWTGVHVYQRVESTALDTALRVDEPQRLFAVPIRLRPGEYQRQNVPAGSWMITTLAEAPQMADGFKLRFVNASCEPNVLNDPRRFGCRTSAGAVVVVYRASNGNDTTTAAGYLLLR